MMPLFRASADLYETEDEIVAKFDLPGVRREDIEVEIVNDSLQVFVEKSTEREVSRGNAFFMERSSSGFFRSIGLPPEADTENVQADYREGVLTVRMPIRGAHGRGEPSRGERYGAPSRRPRDVEMGVARELEGQRYSPQGPSPARQLSEGNRRQMVSSEEELELRSRTLRDSPPWRDQQTRREASIYAPSSRGMVPVGGGGAERPEYRRGEYGREARQLEEGVLSEGRQSPEDLEYRRRTLENTAPARDTEYREVPSMTSPSSGGGMRPARGEGSPYEQYAGRGENAQSARRTEQGTPTEGRERERRTVEGSRGYRSRRVQVR